MSNIIVKNLKKSFGDNIVINNFNLNIKDGEFIVLVGPSGCGKSTLLRMISGLESIDQGEIFLDQKLINNLLPSKRDIAMVFQSYALYPHMNVFENMSFGLKMEKIPKSEINQKLIMLQLHFKSKTYLKENLNSFRVDRDKGLLLVEQSQEIQKFSYLMSRYQI